MTRPVSIGFKVDHEAGPAGQETRLIPPTCHQLRRLFQRGGFVHFHLR